MLTTPQLRAAWAPPCNDADIELVYLVEGVRVNVHRKCRAAVAALGRVFEAHRYHVRREDTGAYNCRSITGGSGYSLHAYGIAIDINWNTNPYRADNVLVTDMPEVMRDDVKRIRTMTGKRVWGLGADYGSRKDAMHYEIVCAPADLASGIDWQTVRQESRQSPVEHHPLIRRGDRGPAVQMLQQILGVVQPGGSGYGTFGPRTEAAVKQYQATRGLTVDGVVGRQTWTALLNVQPPVAADEPGPVKRANSGDT